MPSSPLIRYRLVMIDGQYSVQWRCGMRWLLVYGPIPSEMQAREWMDGMLAQVL